MSKYIIHTTEHPYGGWSANFDSYDGAPDSGKLGILGQGKTEEDAIVDLFTADDLKYYGEADLDTYKTSTQGLDAIGEMEKELV